jgi:hypothetical protein
VQFERLTLLIAARTGWNEDAIHRLTIRMLARYLVHLQASAKQ